ncbi:MAG: hypothetical protein OEZ06_27810 [Myxococcales bacterium]|nr:hypothetical protein [Myxococcales bacterium]
MDLCYRAGPRALQTLRQQGLSADTLRALIAPAAGPKWLAVAGMDRALMASGLLSERRRPLLLLGASAGAWRSMALCARDPQATHRALAHGYIRQRFARDVGNDEVSAAYRELLAEVFPDSDAEHALGHAELELAVIAVRARGATGSASRPLQMLGMGAAAALNLLGSRAAGLFFERTLFHRRQGSAAHPLLQPLTAARVQLEGDNIRQALLASGTVPLYMAPVRDIAGAPTGGYIDGGITDYHINQPLGTGGDGVALLFLHQRRLSPTWFDKQLPFRRPRAPWLEDLLLVHPSDAWISSLPGGRVPTRDDFLDFVDAPEERIERWTQALGQSEALGEQLLEDLQSGRFVDRLQPL